MHSEVSQGRHRNSVIQISVTTGKTIQSLDSHRNLDQKLCLLAKVRYTGSQAEDQAIYSARRRQRRGPGKTKQRPKTPGKRSDCFTLRTKINWP